MMKIPIPPVPELARASGSTLDEVVNWFVDYFESETVPWNYRTGTICLKQGYRGLHNIKQLIAACALEKIDQGKRSNEEIVSLAAPLAFGRSTQVFDLPRRQFPFGRDLHAGYRVPFFFVEDGVVKLYYVQPRKGFHLSYDQLCMVATIHKKYLLDTEFFGLKVDVEYIDLSADPLTNVRTLRQYSLQDLKLWPEKRLADRLTLISDALEVVRSKGLAKPRKRPDPRPDPEMPLFK